VKDNNLFSVQTPILFQILNFSI